MLTRLHYDRILLSPDALVGRPTRASALLPHVRANAILPQKGKKRVSGVGVEPTSSAL